MKLNKKENYILDALEQGELELSAPSKKEIESIKSAANNTFKKDKRITIRLYEHDFNGIQKKSDGNGNSIPNAYIWPDSSIYRRRSQNSLKQIFF